MTFMAMGTAEKPLCSISRQNDQRRASKPLMEKRRRARINHCLSQLKSLLLDATRKDLQQRHTKLEKADILEMTVRHLQALHRHQAATAPDTSSTTKFLAGFTECAKEVSRFVQGMENLDPSVSHTLVNHLSTCVKSISDVNGQLSNNNNREHVKPQQDNAPVTTYYLTTSHSSSTVPHVTTVSTSASTYLTSYHHHQQSSNVTSSPLNLTKETVGPQSIRELCHHIAASSSPVHCEFSNSAPSSPVPSTSSAASTSRGYHSDSEIQMSFNASSSDEHHHQLMQSVIKMAPRSNSVSEPMWRPW